MQRLCKLTSKEWYSTMWRLNVHESLRLQIISKPWTQKALRFITVPHWNTEVDRGPWVTVEKFQRSSDPAVDRFEAQLGTTR